MATPDGYWRVEVVRVPMTKQRWYRIWHAQTLVAERATIGMVQAMLGEQYADLQPVDAA